VTHRGPCQPRTFCDSVGCEACSCFGCFRIGTGHFSVCLQEERSRRRCGLGFHLPVAVEYGRVACGTVARSRSRAPGRDQSQHPGRGRVHLVSWASAPSCCSASRLRSVPPQGVQCVVGCQLSGLTIQKGVFLLFVGWGSFKAVPARTSLTACPCVPRSEHSWEGDGL